MAPPLNFLHVISSVDPVGGGPIEGALRLHEALCRQGHEGAFLSCDDPDAAHLKAFPAAVHALGPARLNPYGYCSRLVPWLRREAPRYDAVIVNGLWQYHGLATRRALRSAFATPYFVFPHGMLDPWFKRRHPLKHLKKWLYWPWAEYRVLRDAASVLFTCEEERLLARESFWLYRANEKVISFGTASPPADAAALAATFHAAFPTTVGKRLLLFLGRLHPKKGGDLLLQAFAQHGAPNPDLHLVMAGPDQNETARDWQRLAAQLGIADRVTWTGMLAGDLKWGAIYACEAFCLTSHQENFGVAVAEAMACGRAVLISNKVNIWREIQEGGAGLVEEDTQAGASRLLSRWLDLAPAEREDMGAAALDLFARRFHIDRVAQRLAEHVRTTRPERPGTLASKTIA